MGRYEKTRGFRARPVRASRPARAHEQARQVECLPGHDQVGMINTGGGANCDGDGDDAARGTPGGDRPGGSTLVEVAAGGPPEPNNNDPPNSGSSAGGIARIPGATRCVPVRWPDRHSDERGRRVESCRPGRDSDGPRTGRDDGDPVDRLRDGWCRRSPRCGGRCGDRGRPGLAWRGWPYPPAGRNRAGIDSVWKVIWQGS